MLEGAIGAQNLDAVHAHVEHAGLQHAAFVQDGLAQHALVDVGKRQQWHCLCVL